MRYSYDHKPQLRRSASTNIGGYYDSARQRYNDHGEYSSTDKVLNIGYRNRIGWGFSYQISDIRGDIGDTRAYRAFISDIIYNEILITKS